MACLLYDLRRDLEEKKDATAESAEVQARLMALLKQQRDQGFSATRRLTVP